MEYFLVLGHFPPDLEILLEVKLYNILWLSKIIQGSGGLLGPGSASTILPRFCLERSELWFRFLSLGTPGSETWSRKNFVSFNFLLWTWKYPRSLIEKDFWSGNLFFKYYFLPLAYLLDFIHYLKAYQFKINPWSLFQDY